MNHLSSITCGTEHLDNRENTVREGQPLPDGIEDDRIGTSIIVSCGQVVINPEVIVSSYFQLGR